MFDWVRVEALFYETSVRHEKSEKATVLYLFQESKISFQIQCVVFLQKNFKLNKHYTRIYIFRYIYLFPLPSSLSNRNYMGHGSSYSLNKLLKKGIKSYHKIEVGYDIAYQRDERQRFVNAEGLKGGQTLNQIESFTNLAFYVQDKININRLNLHAALRYDWNELKATDRFLDNGDDSGKINLSAFNPAIGLSYQLWSSWYLLANYRSSFETPSFNTGRCCSAVSRFTRTVGA